MLSSYVPYRANSTKISNNSPDEGKEASFIFDFPRGLLTICTLLYFGKSREACISSCCECLFESFDNCNISQPSERAVMKCIRSLRDSGYLRPIAPRWYAISVSGDRYLQNISSVLSSFTV